MAASKGGKKLVEIDLALPLRVTEKIVAKIVSLNNPDIIGFVFEFGNANLAVKDDDYEKHNVVNHEREFKLRFLEEFGITSTSGDYRAPVDHLSELRKIIPSHFKQVFKGIMSKEDATQALTLSPDALWISNR